MTLRTFCSNISSKLVRHAMATELRMSLERITDIKPEELELLIDKLELDPPWLDKSRESREANIGAGLNLEALYELRRMLPELTRAGVRMRQIRAGMEKLYNAETG